MIATVEDGRIVKVVGDPANPESRGYSCAKGRAIPELHHRADRLDRPRLHGEEVSWDVLLDDLAEHVRDLITSNGPDQVGLFAGTGVAADPVASLAGRRLVMKLGSGQIYSPLHLDGAPAMKATELLIGFPQFFGWTPESPPTLTVFVGTNPPISSGYITSAGSDWSRRLRAYRRRGGELWVIDPRRTTSAHLADRHLAPRPGTDVFLLAWVVRELLEQGFDAEELATACRPEDVERLRAAVAPYTLALAAERTGLAEGALVDLLEAIRRHRKVAILSGTGVTFQRYHVVTYWLTWVAMILTGSLDREGGLQFIPTGRGIPEEPATGHAPEDGLFLPGPNSRPDLSSMFFGERPSVGLVDEIESGELRALVILGGNPLTAAPDPDRLRAAFAKLEVLAVCDVFDNALTAMATHVLPCSWITERNVIFGMPQFGAGRIYFSPPVMPPSDERRHGWWVFAQLGRRLGIDVLGRGFGLEPDEVDDDTVARRYLQRDYDYADAVIEAGPDGMRIPSSYGWLHEKVLPDRRWRLAPRPLVDLLGEAIDHRAEGLRLVNGRRMDSMNATAYAGDAGPPPIHVSVEAAAEHGVETGDRIRVSTSRGAVEGRAHVDDALSGQSIWINHGWLEQNVNHLTDPTVERLTGQPMMSGYLVQLERVEASAP